MTCYILVMWSFSSRHHSMVMDPEMLARLVFCFENNPERHDGIISGAQDSIGICVPGLVRHYYDNNFWPEKIESTQDEMTLRFLEDHLVMIPMEPRRPGCSVVEGKDITPEKVKALADAADACWKAILAHDLDAFAAAYRASFEAQIAMFPGMVNPSINGVIEPEASVQPMIATTATWRRFWHGRCREPVAVVIWHW